MKTVALIPIKLNNERMPGKNTKEFEDGTPLIHFIQKTLKSITEINEIYIYCSNENIKEYILDGIHYLKRSRHLDSPATCSQDILDSFTDTIDADTYLLVHCTSPFIKAETIQTCIKKVQQEGFDSAFTARKVQDFLWENGKPLNFNPVCIPRTQDLPEIYSEVTACYVFRKEVYRKLRRRIGEHPYICEVDALEAIDLDYPEDFMIANAIYMKLLREENE